MKKYLKALPLILYPYTFLIYLCAISLLNRLAENPSYEINVFGNEIRIDMIVSIFYNLLGLFLALRGAIGAFKQYTPAEAAKINLAVKGWQIPAYLFNFLVGAGILMLGIVWVTFIVIMVDLAAIALSGIYAIGCIRRLKKEGILSSETAILTGIGSFLFVVDVIVAVVLVGMCKRKKSGTTAENPLSPPLPPMPQKPAPAQNGAEEEAARKN